jgi:hypothetical protein
MGGIAPFEEGLRTFLGRAASAVEVGGSLGGGATLLQALGELSPPSTLEDREFIKNTIKQNLTSFS